MTYTTIDQSFHHLKTKHFRVDVLVSANIKGHKQKADAISSHSGEDSLSFSPWESNRSVDEKYSEIEGYFQKILEVLGHKLPSEVKSLMNKGGLLSDHLKILADEPSFGRFFDRLRLYLQKVADQEDSEAKDTALAMFPPQSPTDYACIGGMANRLEDAFRVLCPEAPLCGQFSEFINHQILKHDLASSIRPSNQIHLPSLLAHKLGVPQDIVSKIDIFYMCPIHQLPAWQFYDIYQSLGTLNMEESHSLSEIYQSLPATMEILNKEQVQPDDLYILRNQPIFSLLEEALGPIDIQTGEFLEVVEQENHDDFVRFRPEAFSSLIDRVIDQSSNDEIPLDSFSHVFLEHGSKKLARDLANSEDLKTLEKAIVKMGLLSDQFKGSSPITFIWVLYKLGCLLKPGAKDPLTVGYQRLLSIDEQRDQLSALGAQWVETCIDRFEAFKVLESPTKTFINYLHSGGIRLKKSEIDGRPIIGRQVDLFYQSNLRLPNFLWEHRFRDFLYDTHEFRMKFISYSSRFLPSKGENIDLEDDFTQYYLDILKKASHQSGIQDIFSFAVANGYFPLARYLLRKDLFEDSLYDPDGLLGSALRQGKVLQAELLLKAGAARQAVGSHNPWIEAIEGGHLGCVHALIRTGHSANKVDVDEAPLLIAARCGHTAIVEALLNHKAKINGPNGRSPLGTSLNYGHLEVAKKLLERGANPNIFDLGRSPLIMAIEHKQIELVHQLIDHGADVNLRDHKGHLPLFEAIKSECPVMLKKVLDSGVNHLKLYEKTHTVLSLISEETPEGIVKLLVESLPQEIREAVREHIQNKLFAKADEELVKWIWSQYPIGKKARITFGRIKEIRKLIPAFSH